jgi:hypothetical protein
MKYNVVIQPPDVRDIEAVFLYMKTMSPTAADRWMEGMEAAI